MEHDPPEELFKEMTVPNLLQQGDVIGVRPIWSGQNHIFLVQLHQTGHEPCLAIYKPSVGEAPLRDFPTGHLYMREYAAYLLAKALGWHFIPPTVIRDGPYGIGSMQLFIQHDIWEHYFTLRDRYPNELLCLCLFDLVTNNADRKGGHCLLGTDGRIWGIDHGLTFNQDLKLRTVIWDFANQPIPGRLIEDIRRVSQQLVPGNQLYSKMEELLVHQEIKSLKIRVRDLLKNRRFPDPFFTGKRSWPYPLI